MLKSIKQKLSKFILLTLISAFSFSSSAAISKGYQCAPRVIAQNIQSAVLALKAAKYCTSTDLPYSAAQASIRVDSLRCDKEASALIDELLGKHDQQYKMILTADKNKTACKSAMNISMK